MSVSQLKSPPSPPPPWDIAGYGHLLNKNIALGGGDFDKSGHPTGVPRGKRGAIDIVADPSEVLSSMQGQAMRAFVTPLSNARNIVFDCDEFECYVRLSNILNERQKRVFHLQGSFFHVPLIFYNKTWLQLILLSLVYLLEFLASFFH